MPGRGRALAPSRSPATWWKCGVGRPAPASSPSTSRPASSPDRRPLPAGAGLRPPPPGVPAGSDDPVRPHARVLVVRGAVAHLPVGVVVVGGVRVDDLLPGAVAADHHSYVVPGAVAAPVVVHEVALAEPVDRRHPVGAATVPVAHLLRDVDPAQAVVVVGGRRGAVLAVPPAAAVVAGGDRHAAGAGALRGEVGAVGAEADVARVVPQRVPVGIAGGGGTVVGDDVVVAAHARGCLLYTSDAA